MLNAQIFYNRIKKEYIKTELSLNKALEEVYSLAGKKIDIPFFSLREGSIKSLDFYLNRLKNSPYLKYVSAKEEKQEKKIKYEKLNLIPDVTVSFRYFYRKGFNDYISISFSVPLTFFNQEKYLSKVLYEKTVLSAVKKEYREKYISLEKEIKKAYYQVESSKENLKVLNIILKQSEHLVETSISEFKVGKKNIVDVLFALNGTLSVKREILNEIYNLNLAVVSIKEIVGELR